MLKRAVLCFLIAFLPSMRSIEIPDALIEEVHADCMKEINLDKAKLSEMFNEDFHMKYPHEVTSKFLECVLGKVHFFHEDGGFDKEVITKNLARSLPALVTDKLDDKKTRELAEELYHECSTPKGESSVEKVVNFHNCVMIELKKKATST